MRAIKVIYGAKEKVFSCIEKARAFRDKKKAKYNNIVIRISDDDINPMIK